MVVQTQQRARSNGQNAPLKRDSKVAGAIGISGGSGEQLHAVAEAGAVAF